MIYIYLYFVLSSALTLNMAYQLKQRFGSLDNLVQFFRHVDQEFEEHFKDMADSQVVTMAMIMGFILSPVIGIMWWCNEKK